MREMNMITNTLSSLSSLLLLLLMMMMMMMMTIAMTITRFFNLDVSLLFPFSVKKAGRNPICFSSGDLHFVDHLHGMSTQPFFFKTVAPDAIRRKAHVVILTVCDC